MWNAGALGWRGAAGARVRRWWVFDLMQLALVVLTGLALVALFEAVQLGLLGQPEMRPSTVPPATPAP